MSDQETSKWFSNEELKAKGIDPDNPTPEDGKVLAALVKAKQKEAENQGKQEENKGE